MFLIYGGPDGEMGASMRYLSQRYAMPYGEQKAVLTDIGVSVAKLRIIVLSRFSGSYLEDLELIDLSGYIESAAYDIIKLGFNFAGSFREQTVIIFTSANDNPLIALTSDEKLEIEDILYLH